MSTPFEPAPPRSYEDFWQNAGRPEPPPPAPDFNPDHPRWNFLGGVGLWLASLALTVVCPILFLLPYIVSRGVRAQELGEFATNDPTAVFLQIVAVVPAHLLTLGVAWLIVTRVGRQPFFASLGWGWAPPFTLWRSVGLAVLLLALGYGLIWVMGNVETALDKMLEASRAAALATAFLATFTAPLVEEVVYRGVLYSGLRRSIGAAGAVVTVLLLFALIHVPQYWPNFGVILTILLLSTILTLVRAKTGRLLPCFVIHLVFNAIQSVFIILDPYIKRMGTDTPPAPAPDPAALLSFLKLFH